MAQCRKSIERMKARRTLLSRLVGGRLVVVLLTLTGCCVHADDIGVLYALDADWQKLKGDTAASVNTVGDTVIQTVKLGPHSVRGVRMGAGNVETAINASRLLAKFPCDWVVSLGPAGALRVDLPAGALFVAKEVVGYQRGTWSGQGWSLSPAAQIKPQLPGVMLQQSFPWKNADKIVLASGDAFVANRQERDNIRTMTGADSVDMNSFGAALACDKGKVPLLVLKFRSDAADEDAAEDFKKFIAAYNGHHGIQLRDWIATLPPSPESPQAYDNIKRLLE